MTNVGHQWDQERKYTFKIPKAKDNVWQALPCQRTSFSANWIWTNLGFHSTSYPNGSANPFACGQAQDCHEMFHSSSFCNTWAPLGPTQPKKRWSPLTRPSVCLFSESMLSQKKTWKQQWSCETPRNNAGISWTSSGSSSSSSDPPSAAFTGSLSTSEGSSRTSSLLPLSSALTPF